MALPQRPSTPSDDWEFESDCEYTTVQPPAFIKRSRVDEVLDQSHQIRFGRAIRNLLDSKAAEVTFAQLVDGLPLARFATATQGMRWEPSVLEHETLCPGVIERAKTFRDNLDPAGLDLPTEVLERYQAKPAGSRESKLPFLELIAVATHRIAVLLYKRGSLHKELRPLVEETVSATRFAPTTIRRHSVWISIPTQSSTQTAWPILPGTGQRTGSLAESSSSAGARVESR